MRHNELIAVAIRDIDGDKYEAELLKKKEKKQLFETKEFLVEQRRKEAMGCGKLER